MFDKVKKLMEYELIRFSNRYNKFEIFVGNGSLHTRINVQYDGLSEASTDGIEFIFSTHMKELGFELQKTNSTKIPDDFNHSVVLRHYMIFSIPISMRLTRPSMKILLGLS